MSHGSKAADNDKIDIMFQKLLNEIGRLIMAVFHGLP